MNVNSNIETPAELVNEEEKEEKKILRELQNFKFNLSQIHFSEYRYYLFYSISVFYNAQTHRKFDTDLFIDKLTFTANLLSRMYWVTNVTIWNFNDTIFISNNNKSCEKKLKYS